MAPSATRRPQRRRHQEPPRHPITPVRDHLRALRAAGSSVRHIAQQARLSECGLSKIVNDPRRVYVYGPTAQAILAITPARHAVPRGLPATAATRKLQALAVIGVPSSLAVDWAGGAISHDNLDRIRRGGCSAVTAAVAAAVDRAYRRGEAELMSNFPDPMVVGGDPRVRARALARGWHGPLAWDDDTIGDPDATPADDAPAARRPSHDRDATRVWLALDGVVPAEDLTTAERHEVLKVLVGRGWTDQEIGDHLAWGDTPDRRHDNAQQYRNRANMAQPPAVVGHRVQLRNLTVAAA